ncbi:hypothetical protein WJX73_006262 [Symbiochloris irregularis]|uniref:Aspartyl/asparaginy/proline hydroxylase domain-containing protein n=1 Tax=Symbiochloris irregularis TaxID=706552 RepID=A0AAW1NWV8_9CHLO
MLWILASSGALQGAGIGWYSISAARSSRAYAAEASISPDAPRLLLASHNRLFWYTPYSGKETLLHEGEGVYYGVFAGQPASAGTLGTVWVVSRPHNWRVTSSTEYLLHIDLDTGREINRVAVPSKFAHDAVRWQGHVFICSTGTGSILELSYPSMALTKVLGKLKKTSHVNTLAPDGKGGLWALLHNMGKSTIVSLAIQNGRTQKRILNVGKSAHGLVQWGDSLVTLDSASAALMLVNPEQSSVKRLWKAPESGRFLKGLAVVDDVAYFGISRVRPRSARHDPALNCDLAAFHLRSKKLLWRKEVPTKGLLNTIGAPHLGDQSPHLALNTSGLGFPGSLTAARATVAETRKLLWNPFLSSSKHCQQYAGDAAGCHEDSLCELVDGIHGQGPSCRACKRMGGCSTRRSGQLPFTEHAEVQPKKAVRRGADPLWDTDMSNLDILRLIRQSGAQDYKHFRTPVGGRWASGQPFMNSKLKRKNALKAGVRMDLGQYDITRLKEAMLAFGDRLWNASWLATENAVMAGREKNLAKYKPGTHDATLIFSDNYGESVQHFPLYEVFQLQLQPILDQLLGKEDVDKVMRLQLTCMPPGTTIKVHQDQGGYSLSGHRIHLPLLVPEGDGSLFITCPRAVHGHPPRLEECVELPLREGAAFEFNNALLHAVRNQGPGMRVHLLIDVGSKHVRNPTVLQKGQVCHYVKGRVNCKLQR